MPKLPVISGEDAIRALECLGFVEMRQRGSHVVLRQGVDGCVVPKHRELKTGTLAGLIKQANISVDEFINALKS